MRIRMPDRRILPKIFSYRRWRHTRGYGVHSPFAYEVVSEAVHPRRIYAYYGDTDIECSLLEAGLRAPHAERLARLLLRVCAIVRPEAVFFSETLPPALDITMEAAVRAADSYTAITRFPEEADECSLAVFSGEDNLSLIEGLAGISGMTLLLDEVSTEFQERIFKRVPQGLWLDGYGKALIFNRPGMTRTHYKLFF